MTTLHILNASPVHNSQLNSCLRLLAADDAILLCGEAVQALRLGSAAAQKLLAVVQPYRLYALQEDIQARALDLEAAGLSVTGLDYAGFVAVCVAYTRVNTWT